MLYKDPGIDIDGWLHPICGAAIQGAINVQALNSIKGNSLEIGVYLGKTISHLVCSRNDSEITLGIDPFIVNYPNKNMQSVDILREASSNIKSLKRFNRDIRGETILFKGYSYQSEIISKIKSYKRSFRIISIDGSHLYKDVIGDLKLADEIATAEGIIIIDDFFNILNPEVTIAVNDFLCNTNQGKEWKVSIAVTPNCSPKSASTRIFLEKKNCSIDYGLSIANQLKDTYFQNNECSINDYIFSKINLFGEPVHILLPK